MYVRRQEEARQATTKVAEAERRATEVAIANATAEGVERQERARRETLQLQIQLQSPPAMPVSPSVPTREPWEAVLCRNPPMGPVR